MHSEQHCMSMLMLLHSSVMQVGMAAPSTQMLTTEARHAAVQCSAPTHTHAPKPVGRAACRVVWWLI